MITKKCLYVIINGTQYNYHLHTTATAYGSKLRVRAGGQDLYLPTYIPTGTGLRVITTQGATLKAVDAVPKVTVTYTYQYDSQPYQNPYLYKSMSITMNMDVTINKAVEIQYANGSSWVTALTIAKGGTQASAGSNIRRPSVYWRFKIDSWVSSTLMLNSSSGSNTVTIPEAQWGV